MHSCGYQTQVMACLWHRNHASGTAILSISWHRKVLWGMTLGYLSSRQPLNYLPVLFSPQPPWYLALLEIWPFLLGTVGKAWAFFTPKNTQLQKKRKKWEKTGTIDKWGHKCGERKGNFGKMWNESSGSHLLDWLEKLLLFTIILHNTEHKWC